MNGIGIGSTVWFFDVNRRRYEHGGVRSRSPIWSLHWQPQRVVGETSRSWVTDFGAKLPKRGPLARHWCSDRDDLQDRAWVEANRTHVMEELRDRLWRGDIDRPALERICELTGITPAESGPFPIDEPWREN